MIKQPILAELKFFVSSVSTLSNNSKEISPQLVRVSLNLLNDLPASRDVVFEYFSHVFDTIVTNYVNYTNGSGDSQETPAEEEAIGNIQEALENLVTKGTEAWAPLISTWSLKLLGKLSDRANSKIPTGISIQIY